MDAEAFKAGQKALWALGDFPELARFTRPASQTILKAAGVDAGDALLDVACGTGNLAIPAAELGARVTGIDITPQLLDVARGDAAGAGLSIDFREGDAEALDFDDDSFDKVISVFGMIFAPDHVQAASEMQRTCRSGGTVALAAWTPDGMNGQLFRVIGEHMPPPPEMPSPVQWGSEDHVIENFGEGIEWTFTRENAPFIADSAEEFFKFNEQKLPPLVLVRAALEPQGKYEALREDLLEFYNDFNKADDGSFLGHGEYLLAIGELPA